MAKPSSAKATRVANGSIKFAMPASAAGGGGQAASGGAHRSINTRSNCSRELIGLIASLMPVRAASFGNSASAYLIPGRELQGPKSSSHVRFVATGNAERGNSRERGYDWKWEKFRRWLLGQPEWALCRDCLDKGIITPTRDIHHIIKAILRPDLFYELSNLRPLCGECRKIRTGRGE